MKFRIGTRGSDLALVQTTTVIEALQAMDPSISCDIIEIKTSGDKKQGGEKASFGDKKDWVYELELALLDSTIDIAIHSAKDVPGNTEGGLALLPVLTRATPFDIFIGNEISSKDSRVRFNDLTENAVIGTSSLRRKAALTLYKPTLSILEHRGNVPTRIRKLEQSKELSGIILAAAGIERLGLLNPQQYEVIDRKIMLPSANQGILAAQFREKDSSVKVLLESISSFKLRAEFMGERSCAHALGGDCNSAIGVYASAHGEKITVEASVYDPDGSGEIRASVSGSIDAAVTVGQKLAKELLDRGASKYLL